MLSAMDDAIGRVMNKLKETGKLKGTLVIFHNDNGGPTTRNAVNGSRNTPLRGSKCETFEGGIRVPQLFQWPGVIEAGSVYHEPVMTFDLSATALSLAGADMSDGSLNAFSASAGRSWLKYAPASARRNRSSAGCPRNVRCRAWITSSPGSSEFSIDTIRSMKIGARVRS